MIIHGLYARRPSSLEVVRRKTRRLVERMFGTMPWLGASDRPAVRGWAELEILSAGIFADLTSRGWVVATSGEPRRLLTEFRQLKQTQLQFERELGMTPAARMAIKAHGTRAALDLAAAFAKTEDADTAETGGDGDG